MNSYQLLERVPHYWRCGKTPRSVPISTRNCILKSRCHLVFRENESEIEDCFQNWCAPRMVTSINQYYYHCDETLEYSFQETISYLGYVVLRHEVCNCICYFGRNIDVFYVARIACIDDCKRTSHKVSSTALPTVCDHQFLHDSNGV